MASRKQFSHIDMNGLQTQNLGVPTNANDSATKTYVDSAISTTSSNDRNRANHTGTQLASTISDFVAQVRINKVTDLAAPTSAFGMNNQKITNLGTPTTGTDAVTKQYSDDQDTAAKARANHTGTQTASTISDFNTAVRTNRLNEMLAPNAAVSFNSQRITNLATPTAASDAATKGYVDSFPRRYTASVVSPANVNVSSPGTTFDLLTATAGTKILLVGQTNASQNGLYVWNSATTAMTRAPEWDESADMVQGDSFYIFNGYTYNGSLWSLTTPGPYTVNTTALSFTVSSSDALTTNRAFHIGTQTASTISDFNTAVRTNRLNELTAPNAAVTMGGQRITNLATPTTGTDAANKDYVDTSLASVTNGMTSKGAVKAVIDTNISTTSPNPTTFPNETLVSGDKVALIGQTTASQNGIYTYNGSGVALTRDPSWDTAAEMVPGSFWVVLTGQYQDKFLLFANDTTPTPGTTALYFITYGGTSLYVTYAQTFPIPAIAAGASYTVDASAQGFSGISSYMISEQSTGNIVDVGASLTTPAGVIIRPDIAIPASTYSVRIVGEK